MLRVTGSSAVIRIVLLMTVCDRPIEMFTTKQFQLSSNFQKCSLAVGSLLQHLSIMSKMFPGQPSCMLSVS